MEEQFELDARFFLEKAACHITTSGADIVESTLFLALGLERLLKSILFRINPAFVFIKPDFENLTKILYKDLTVSEYKFKDGSNCNSDVITFRASIQRAGAFSQVTFRHTALLNTLANFRDIIAHTTLSELDRDKMTNLLNRDYYPLIISYCEELQVRPELYLGQYHRQLATLAAEHQDSVEERLDIKLRFHKQQWESRSGSSDFVNRMRGRTEYVLNREMIDGRYRTETDCPACGNTAVLNLEVDYDICDGQAMPMGVFVNSIECMFCQLRINDYDEMDELKLNERLADGEDIM